MEIENETLQTLFASLIDIINKVLVPVIFALAFFLFLVGVFKYFFAGDSDDKRKEGRKFIMWGIIALAVMISVWGLVNIVVRTFNLDESRPCLPTFSGERNCPGSSGNSAPVGGVLPPAN